MSLTTQFLDAVAVAAEQSAGPMLMPWPMPGKIGGLVEFATFAEWRDFMLLFAWHRRPRLVFSPFFGACQECSPITP